MGAGKVTYSMLYSVVFVAAIAMANIIAAKFGPAVTPITSFVLIGLDLSLRDKLHDTWVGRGLWWRMGILISCGALVAWLVSPGTGRIGVASCAAFAASSVADSLVYQAVRGRGFIVRANASNVAGAAVDSILFPTVAFGALMPGIVAAQFAVKIAGGALWAFALSRVENRAAGFEVAE